MTASGTTVMDFSVSFGEGNRGTTTPVVARPSGLSNRTSGPLTSTPMFEKTFNHFEAFISQNIVDESPSRKSVGDLCVQEMEGKL